MHSFSALQLYNEHRDEHSPAKPKLLTIYIVAPPPHQVGIHAIVVDDITSLARLATS